MTTITGDALVIEIEDTTPTPAVWVPVNDMNRFDRNTTRSTTRQRVFMRARAYLLRGAREFTSSISGFLNLTDPGQTMIRDAMETDAIVNLRVLPDGVNGIEQQFYVGRQTAGATPEATEMQAGGWELADAADPVMVGTGPIF